MSRLSPNAFTLEVTPPKKINMTNIEIAHYLPMAKFEFVVMFGEAIQSGEITGMEVTSYIGSERQDVSYSMKDKTYVSAKRYQQLRES
ncbi:hypothetical protein [Vibrio alginolyticus]|uniref:hypothetical protein n=1 Tax=Vibrio alginolyticus TaxID=663 RepID=UPI0015F41425|nr:hypothetical protein [Vibrio alginolyticus]